ncbi:hypothetical protein QTP88_024349 [Uroleucon formosanum]
MKKYSIASVAAYIIMFYRTATAVTSVTINSVRAGGGTIRASQGVGKRELVGERDRGIGRERVREGEREKKIDREREREREGGGGASPCDCEPLGKVKSRVFATAVTSTPFSVKLPLATSSPPRPIKQVTPSSRRSVLRSSPQLPLASRTSGDASAKAAANLTLLKLVFTLTSTISVQASLWYMFGVRCSYKALPRDADDLCHAKRQSFDYNVHCTRKKTLIAHSRPKALLRKSLTTMTIVKNQYAPGVVFELGLAEFGVNFRSRNK